FGRDRSGHDEEILPKVGLHDRFLRGFRGVPCRSHEGVTVVQRDQIEEQVSYRRLGCPKHTFPAAGAFLELEPDLARAFHLLKRGRHLLARNGAQPEHDGEIATESQEFPAGYAGALQVLSEGISLGPWMGKWDVHGESSDPEGGANSSRRNNGTEWRTQDLGNSLDHRKYHNR